jgi:hypothetical protein
MSDVRRPDSWQRAEGPPSGSHGTVADIDPSRLSHGSAQDELYNSGVRLWENSGYGPPRASVHPNCAPPERPDLRLYPAGRMRNGVEAARIVTARSWELVAIARKGSSPAVRLAMKPASNRQGEMRLAVFGLSSRLSSYNSLFLSRGPWFTRHSSSPSRSLTPLHILAEAPMWHTARAPAVSDIAPGIRVDP